MRFAKQRSLIVALFLMLPLAASLAFVQTPLVSDFVLRFALKVVRFRTRLKVDARTWDVSPFVFSARLEGVTFEVEKLSVRVPTLSMQISPLSLLMGEIHLRRLSLENPEVSGKLPPSAEDGGGAVERPNDIPTWIGRRLASTMGELQARHLNIDDLEGLRLALDVAKVEGLDLRLSNLELGQARVELSVRGIEVPSKWKRIEELSAEATLLRESGKTFYLALPRVSFRLGAEQATTRMNAEGRWPGRLRGRIELNLAELGRFAKGSPSAPADLLLARAGGVEIDFDAEAGKAKLLNLNLKVGGRDLHYDDFRLKGLSLSSRTDLESASPVTRIRDVELDLPAAKNDRVNVSGKARAKELTVENSILRGRFAFENASVCSIQEAAGAPDCYSALGVSGTADLEGPVDPLELKARLDLQTGRTLVGGDPFANVPLVPAGQPDPGVTVVVKPARLHGDVVVKAKHLQMSPVSLEWPDGSLLRAEGRIEYKPTVLDIFAVAESAKMESMLENLADLQWEGEVRAEARVQYSMSLPKEAGRTQVFSRAQIRSFGLQGQVFGDINGPFIFTGDTLRLGAFQVKSGGGSARVDGSLRMPSGSPSRLQLNGVFERIEIGSKSAESGREIFRGFVSGTGNLEGGLNALKDPENFLAGNLVLRADSFRFYGFPFQSALAEARYEKSKLVVRSIRAKKGDATVEVEGVLDPKGGSELRFRAKDLVVRDMELDPGLAVLEDGKAHFEGLWKPSSGWGLEGRLSQVKLAGRTLPDGPLRVGGGENSFRVAVDLPGAADVEYEMREPKGAPPSMKLKARLRDDGLYGLFAYLEGWTTPVPIETKGGLDVDIDGERGSFSTQGLEVAGRRQSDGTRRELLQIPPGQRVAWTGRRLDQASFSTAGPNPFRVTGSPGDSRLRFEGELPLAFVDFFVPSIRMSTGTLFADGQMSLPPSLASLTAKGQVRDGELLIEGIDEPAAAVDGNLDFRDGRLFIESGSGRLGGGNVSFSGAYKLDGAKAGISLRARLNRAHLIVLDDVPMDVTGDISLTGEDFPWMLAGQLSAVNGLYTKPFTGGETPEAPRDPRLRFDLDFEVGSNIVIRNELVNAPIQGRLHLAGTDQSPLLQGRLLMGSGVIYANENEFRIAQGNIAFTGAPSNIPIVNLEASTNFRTPNQTYRIQISANGPGDALNFGFSSEPSLPTADIVNLLAFGILRPGDSATGTEISSESNAANAAQWQALQMLFGKALGQNLDRRTGIQVRVQTAQSKTQAEAIPKLTVHRKLTDRVSVVVGSSLDQRQPEKDVQVDYRLFNNVNLTGVWENPKPDESSMGVDLRFKFDLK
jgi:hypothetical protein